ncbi:MAG TPA: SOS response-associated peptidase [Usitatibacter sp.]|nr:SOS response-associated peptidase [Usitatibacter sp.]
MGQVCSRYFLDADGNVIAYTFRVPVDERIRRRFNIAPSQEAPVIRATREGGGREVAMLRWGLVPFWAKDPSVGSRMINARSETVSEKPAFREAMRSRRCAVPASGFYEWTGEPRRRVPHAITVEERPVVAFAGLWERWKDREGRPLETYTILTTPANRFVGAMHDRMPAILAEDDVEAWLAGSPEQARKAIRPYPDEAMRERVVSRAINDPRNESGRMPEADGDPMRP